MARTMDTRTLHSGIYAFTFDQKGLMRIRIQGSKIERIHENKSSSLTVCAPQAGVESETAAFVKEKPGKESFDV